MRAKLAFVTRLSAVA